MSDPKLALGGFNYEDDIWGTRPSSDRRNAPLVNNLLASTSGFDVVGIVLAGGQGIIPMGCVMGQQTATGKWAVYNTNNSDGTQTARGILRDEVDTGVGVLSNDTMGEIFVAGVLKNNLISGADSNAVTTLKARVDSALSIFRF